MASSAGVNRVPTYGGGVLLDGISSATTALANQGLASYGTIGVNDSGGQMLEAIGYSKWGFQLVADSSTALSGFQVLLLGTLSPYAYLTWTNANQGQTPYPTANTGTGVGKNWLPTWQYGVTNNASFNPGVQPWEWVPIPGPSEQSGTGNIANPLTETTPLLFTTSPWVAVRAVVVATPTTGVARVYGFAIP